MTSPSFDPQASSRQYGVLTVSEAPATAAYTGADTFPWAGDTQEGGVVTVQGNFLEGEAVVEETMAAFLETPGPLPDRLLQALVAGSAAGGDRRCNRDGARQTAAAAFIVVARAEQAPFAVPALGVTEVGQSGSPWVYLSVVEPIGGENAVALLQEQYQRQAGGQPLPEARGRSGDRPARLRLVLLLLPAVVLALFLGRLLARSRQQHE